MSFVIKTGKTIKEAVENALKELRVTRDQVEIEVIEEPSKGFLGLIGGKEATVKVREIEKTQDLLKEILQDDFSVKNTPNEKKPSYKQENPTLKKPKEASLINDNLKYDKEKKEVSYKEKPNEKTYFLDDVEEDKKITEFLEKIMKVLELEYRLDIQRSDEVLNVNIIGEPEKMGIVIGKRGITLDAIQYLLSLMVNKHRENYIRVSLDSSGYREKREETLRHLAHKMAKKVEKTKRPIRLEPMNAAERRIIHATLQEVAGISTHSEGREPYRKVVIHKEREY